MNSRETTTKSVMSEPEVTHTDQIAHESHESELTHSVNKIIPVEEGKETQLRYRKNSTSFSLSLSQLFLYISYLVFFLALVARATGANAQEQPILNNKRPEDERPEDNKFSDNFKGFRPEDLNYLEEIRVEDQTFFNVIREICTNPPIISLNGFLRGKPDVTTQKMSADEKGNWLPYSCKTGEGETDSAECIADKKLMRTSIMTDKEKQIMADFRAKAKTVATNWKNGFNNDIREMVKSHPLTDIESKILFQQINILERLQNADSMVKSINNMKSKKGGTCGEQVQFAVMNALRSAYLTGSFVFHRLVYISKHFAGRRDNHASMMAAPSGVTVSDNFVNGIFQLPREGQSHNETVASIETARIEESLGWVRGNLTQPNVISCDPWNGATFAEAKNEPTGLLVNPKLWDFAEVVKLFDFEPLTKLPEAYYNRIQAEYKKLKIKLPDYANRLSFFATYSPSLSFFAPSNTETNAQSGAKQQPTQTDSSYKQEL